ncbi:hypothetical protein K3495_g5224 [Podosphaera aphanis]|nr:hypothetical protein K3495_g5224 [Podosphaera aphanis]
MPPCGYPSDNVEHAVMICPLRAEGRAEVWRKSQVSNISSDEERLRRFKKTNAVDLRPEVARAVPVGWGSGEEAGARERGDEAIDMREIHTMQNSVIALPEGKHKNKEFYQVGKGVFTEWFPPV